MTQDTRKLVEALHPLERKVLPHLEHASDVPDLVQKSGMQEIEVLRAINWLRNKKALTLAEDAQSVLVLEKNGKEYKERGLPETRFLEVLDDSAPVKDVQDKAGLTAEEAQVSLGLLKKRDAITITKGKSGISVSLTDKGRELRDKGLPEQRFLKHGFPLPAGGLSADDKRLIQELAKRKQILRTESRKRISYTLTALGKRLAREKLDDRIADQLTPAMLKDGSWKDTRFRRYDVTAPISPVYGGKRHFVEQAISYIKRIWLDLGFREMQGNLVQTAFWDLDALFVPQDHPAREEQDTFYLKDPAKGTLPGGIMQKVRAVHESGGDTGSTGWGGKWSEDVAKENLLRTHTTVLSAQTIAGLKKSDLPAKFFSVGKVFRNEALSWKHLFEFIQVEGIVVDPDANFKNLKGYLTEFFQKMGFEKVRIRPAHFPYTEPSAEVDVYHPGKRQWVELGGSGIFRPEVVKPLLGEDVPVLAWGLGLERSIMEYYGLEDVRDIYGNDLKRLRESRIWLK